MKDKDHETVAAMPYPKYLRLKEKLVKFVEARQENPAGMLTLREAAKLLRITQGVVEVLAEDAELIINIGISTGNGHGTFDTVGDYQLETPY